MSPIAIKPENPPTAIPAAAPGVRVELEDPLASVALCEVVGMLVCCRIDESNMTKVGPSPPLKVALAVEPGIDPGSAAAAAVLL